MEGHHQSPDLPETDYVPAFSAGEQMLGGRKVRYETFGDEAEVDAMRNELLATPLTSEKVRGYIDEMLEYLSWPIPHDGFDFDENDAPNIATTAHAYRRKWEATLPADEKRRADKVALNLNQISGILNSLTVLQQFSQMPGVQEAFKDADGNIPPAIDELAQAAGTLLPEFSEKYKDILFDTRVETVKRFRVFVKRAARMLIDAYRAPQAAAA